jgi:hypothetical protein
MREEKAGRGVDHVLACRPVEPAYRGLLLLEARCLVPRRDLGFDFLAGGPAEPRLVAVGADRRIT